VIISGSLGLPQLDSFNFLLIMVTPLFLALLTITSPGKIAFNKRFLFLTLFFAATMSISFCFSQNYAQSQPHLIRLFAGLSLMLFGALFGQYLRTDLPKMLIFLGVIFSLISLLLTNVPLARDWLMPKTGYNLVFPTYRLHNHLGDFLVLPILALIYNLNRQKKPLLILGWIFIFGLLVFYSYSRSSYLALAVSLTALAIMQIKQKIKLSQLALIILLGLLAVLFLVITTKESAVSINWLDAIENKPLLNGRDRYWGASLATIKDYFWFGIGEGNFVYAMGRYNTTLFDWTQSSLNILLSIFCENGVFAFLTFAALLVWIIKNSRFDLNFLFFLALLTNFQTNYTYEIAGVWLLFWLVMGLSVKNKAESVVVKPEWVLIPGLISLVILISTLFFNPLNQTAHEHLIVEQLFKQQYRPALLSLRLYQKIYRADAISQYAAANYYLALNKPRQALAAYYQAYLWNPFANLDLYRRIYALEKKLNGEKAARLFLKDYQNKVKKLTADDSFFLQKIKKDLQELSPRG
jgi:O-antigen ligase